MYADRSVNKPFAKNFVYLSNGSMEWTQEKSAIFISSASPIVSFCNVSVTLDPSLAFFHGMRIGGPNVKSVACQISK